jgi:hypothetical protein
MKQELSVVGIDLAKAVFHPPVSSLWEWARLLKRVLAINMERRPRCQQSILRLIAAIAYRPIIR